MTVAAHGGDIYQNQITYDFSVNTNPLPLPEILQKRMAEGVCVASAGACAPLQAAIDRVNAPASRKLPAV